MATWVRKSDRTNTLAEECLRRILELLGRRRDVEFEIAKQLDQIRTNRWFVVWGYSSFSKWVKANLGVLDMTYTKVHYLMRQVDLLKVPGVTEEKLLSLPRTVRRELSRLSPNKPQEVEAFINKAVKSKISPEKFLNEISLAKDGRPRYLFSFCIRDSAQNIVVQQALRQAKNGRHLSETEAFYVICEAYIQFCK